MDVSVFGVSPHDDDIDCTCEGGRVYVLVVLVRGADRTDCTTEVVHRGRRKEPSRAGPANYLVCSPIRD